VSEAAIARETQDGAALLVGGCKPEEGFLREVEHLSGQKVVDCYQCGECTAGCPVAFAMDLTPNQVTRLVQLGMADEALHSRSIWLCAGCETCATRCPKLVEISKVMDALRQIASRRGIRSPETEVQTFHETFMQSVEMGGRLHELSMIGLLKLRTRKFFKDVPVGIGLFFKGKLSPLPSGVRDKASIRRMFAHARQRKQRAEGRQANG